MSATRRIRGALAASLAAALVFGGLTLAAPAASATEPAGGTSAGTSAVTAGEPGSADGNEPSQDPDAGAGGGAGSETDPAAPTGDGSNADTATPGADSDDPVAQPAPQSAPQPAAPAGKETAARALAAELPAALEPVREQGGALNWGFKESWRSYVSKWAAGTQTAFGGASLNTDGTIRFPESAASTFDPEAGTGVVAFTGGVLWQSEAHGFAIALQNPRVQVAADGSATVTAETSTSDTAGASEVTRITVATIDALGEPASADGQLSWSNVAGTFAPALAPGGIARYAGQPTDSFALSTPAAPEAPEPNWAPKLEVALANGTPVTAETQLYRGDKLVVTGTGFDPAANVGGRGVPIPNTLPQGNYVVFGNFAEKWQPSQGAPSSSRKAGPQGWVLAKSVLDQVPDRYRPTIEQQWVSLGDDGAFSWTVTLGTTGEVEGGRYGIYSYGAGGVTNAAQEIGIPLNYSDTPRPVGAAQLDGFEAASTGLTASVSGSGFTGEVAPAGVYVAIVEADAVITSARQPEVAAVSYLPANSLPGGVLDADITAAPAKLDRAKSYEVLVWKAHGVASAEATFLRERIALTSADWDRIHGTSAQRALVKVDVSAASETGLDLDVNISQIALQPSDAGVYLALIERGTEAELTQGNMGLDSNFLPRGGITDGAVAAKLSAEADSLDRAKQYEVLVWRAHGNASLERILGRGDVVVTDEQWDAVLGGPDAPEGEAKVMSATEAGLGLSASLRGLAPQAYPNGVYVGVIEAGTANTATMQTVLGAGWIRTIPENGAFSHAFNVSSDQLDRAKRYEVLVWKGHSLPGAANNVLLVPLEITAAAWDQVFPPEVETTDGSFAWGVRQAFREYVRGPIAGGKITVQSPATGTDVFEFPQIAGGDWDAETGTGTVRYAGLVNFSGHHGALNLNLANPVIQVTSARSASLLAPHGASGALLEIAKLDLANAKRSELEGGAIRYESVPVKLTEAGAKQYFEEYLDAAATMDRAAFTIGQASDEDPANPPEKPTQEKPKPKPQPDPAPLTGGGQQAGSLTWGVSSGFASYATGPIAKGGVSTNGVGGGPGGYVFPQSGSSWNAATQTGTVQYSGVVTFTGHKGLLSESFGNPVISVTSATSGTISAGGRTFGLDLASGAKSVGPNGEVTWSGVPLSGGISGGGSGSGGSGGGSFGADPVTFTVGAANGARFGATSVGAESKKRTPAATPPATTGVTVLTPSDELVPGGEIEISASGYEPGERDILVVLYSEPIVLDEAAGADASGTVRWIGNLPEDIALGEHTITIQGSTDTGAPLEVVAPAEDKKAKSGDAKAELLTAENVRSVKAAGVAGDGATLLLWGGAAALLLVAGVLSGLVVRQRRNG